jgi:hypothetical protein
MPNTMHFAWAGGALPADGADTVFAWHTRHPEFEIIVWLKPGPSVRGARDTFGAHPTIHVSECDGSVRTADGSVRPVTGLLLPAVQGPPLAALRGAQVSTVQGSPLPEVGRAQLSTVQGAQFPTVGRAQISTVQGTPRPTVGGALVPAVQGAPLPTVGGELLPAVQSGRLTLVETLAGEPGGVWTDPPQGILIGLSRV